MIGKRRDFVIALLLTLFLLSSANSAFPREEHPSKEEIVGGYCTILAAENKGELTEQVDRLFSTARSMVIESLDIKGVGKSWAIGVRSLRQSLDAADEVQLSEDRTKIARLTGTYEPSLKKSVCEWEKLLGQEDTARANNYALWEVVGNINKVGEATVTEFYKSLLAQLKDLAGTKIPDLTEEEMEKKLENTLEEVKVCKEDCQFTELQKAVSAARPGGIITLEAGVYDVNSTVEKDLTIKGEGRDKVKLQGKKEGHPVLTIGSSAVVNLSGLTVQFALLGEGDESCASRVKGICPHGIAVRAGARLEITDVSVYGNWKGIRLSDNATAIVRESLISRNSYYGFHLTENSTVDITGSTVSEGSAGIYLKNYAVAEVRDSTMEDFGNGFFLWDGSSATVQNCKLVRMEFGAFLNDRARIKFLKNEIIEVESLTFNTPMFFSGKIEKSGNKFQGKEEEGEIEEEAEKSPQLEILGWELSRGDNWVWVKGRAKNVSGSSLVIAEVKGLFYDSQDKLVTTMTASTVGLDDGDVWSFEISAYFDPSKIDRVEVVEGDCSGGFF